MKLSEHTEQIRVLIDTAFRNRLGRMGIIDGALQPIQSISTAYHEDRRRMESIREVFIAETGTVKDAYEKLVEELTFTLFNRLAALKVMEAHTLHPEIITRKESHGGRSFAHLAWLEAHPEARSQEAEGLLTFIEDQLKKLSADIPLFNLEYPYHLLPTSLELNGIIHAFNQMSVDDQVETDIWKSDDVLGWLYESYNKIKKKAHDDSGEKTEYNLVSLQSQYYTPRWVVKFLLDNSLVKLYLEMYPKSQLREKYKVANTPVTNSRSIKPLTEVKVIDPACGSGNFLLYAFDLFYDMYKDQIDNYGLNLEEKRIPNLIIANNLHGIDLDDRAIQLAQLGLYIKAKRKNRHTQVKHFNVVSSDFFLPEYQKVQGILEGERPLPFELQKIVTDLWSDLQQAFKFGALIRLDEVFNHRIDKLVKQFSGPQTSLLEVSALVSYDQFRDNFFNNLFTAVESNATKQGKTFLTTKAKDAITFLEVLTQKYDVAVANPPYTDSAAFGPELKSFIDTNYKQPDKFNTNLYASFIKRCIEITDNTGKVAMVHPPTFMYIKTFEEVRKFMVEKTHISLFVEWGYLGMFHPSARVDSAMYILEKEYKSSKTLFIKLNDIYEGKRYDAFVKIYDDLISNRPNELIYSVPQEKLKIIEGCPFIYWISDGFRGKFKEKTILDLFNPAQGAATTNNNRFLRFWWEVSFNDISRDFNNDKKRWVVYSKGGPFVKWYGNLWTVLDWNKNGQDLVSAGAVLRNNNFYFKEGATYSASGSKGTSYRYLPSNCIFDTGGSCIFPGKELKNIPYLISFLNSSLSSYIVECLNPTVNTQVGDIQRIPFVRPPVSLEAKISSLASSNIEIRKKLCSFRIVETNYESNPLSVFIDSLLRDRLLSYLNYENSELTSVLIHEAIINDLIFQVYELSIEDRTQVETKMGKSIGSLPLQEEALIEFESVIILGADETSDIVSEYLKSLSTIDFDPDKKREIQEGFISLYQSNNHLEEFCIRHQVNPINVWYWFKEAHILPPARAEETALEFLADVIRTLLHEDPDGIIPLVALPGEHRLAERLEQYCLQNGFTAAQYMQFDGLLGRHVNEYLEHYFFKELSDHLNLFMYLPKTPFIWHLSSGEHQGFEAYILIYKWNRDSLFKLKSQYISHRVQNLEYRQIQLQDVHTASAQNEKEKIRLQLREIESFTKKIDELIAEGYDPKLDDGVGKNIAPLQKKGMLRAEVLKSTGRNSQLEKYLNADW